MTELYRKIICIIKKIQPSSRIIRLNGTKGWAYRISIYRQIIIVFQNICIIQTAVWRNTDSLSRINITYSSMSTDRQCFFCSMLQKLKLNLCISYRINKYTDTVFGKANHRISFIIFPCKRSSAFILNNWFCSAQIITGFCILYSYKDESDINNISISIFSYIVITHPCASCFIVRSYTNTLCVTFAFSIVWKSFPVQIITPKRFICGNSGLKLHVKAITIIYNLVTVPCFYS